MKSENTKQYWGFLSSIILAIAPFAFCVDSTFRNNAFFFYFNLSENIKEGIYRFNSSHILPITGILLLIVLLIDFIPKDNKKPLLIRILNTIGITESYFIKSLYALFFLGLLILSIHYIFNGVFKDCPEILLLSLIALPVLLSTIQKYSLIGTHKVKEDKSGFLFVDEPIAEYEKLNALQKQEVAHLKLIIDNSNNSPVSVALNSRWGGGKTSILNGLKDKLNQEGKYEVIEINLWKAKSPENAIADLENSFKTAFRKVFLCISNQGIAFFSALAGKLHSSLSILEPFNGVYQSISATEDDLNRQIEQYLKLTGKNKFVILIDDLERTNGEHLNEFMKLIRYTAGLNGVVSISGVNMNEIVQTFSKNDNLIVNADNQSWAKRDSKKEEEIVLQQYSFHKINHESFVSKIFTMQRDVVLSVSYMDEFIEECNIHIHQFKEFLEKKGRIKDASNIQRSLEDFLAVNNDLFPTHRSIKQFLNEVFIYILGFGGIEGDIELRDYIEYSAIYNLSWLKISYPDFYDKLIDYILTHDNPQISNPSKSIGQKLYDLEKYIINQTFVWNNHHEDFPSEDHKQIYKVFGKYFSTHKYRNLSGFYNGIKYEKSILKREPIFRYINPIIERWETTLVDFKKFDEFNSIPEFEAELTKIWLENYPHSLKNFINKARLKKFEFEKILNIAEACINLRKGEERSKKPLTNEFWNWVVSLLNPASESIVSTNNFIEKLTKYYCCLFTIWESFQADDVYLPEFWSDNRNIDNLFVAFMSPHAITSNEEEVIKVYSSLKSVLNLHSFNDENLKLKFVISLGQTFGFTVRKDDNDPSMIRDLDKKAYSHILELFFDFLNTEDLTFYPREWFYEKGNYGFDLIKYSVDYEFDSILFTPEHIQKLIFLFKLNGAEFNVYLGFISAIEQRNRESKFCKASALEIKPFLEFDHSRKEIFMQFFKIKS